MAKYVCVLPYAYKPYYEACSKTIKLDNVLAIDNTVNNIGIMASHNLGIKYMQSKGADWLIVISAALRFGPQGGCDFIAELDKRPDHLVVEAIGVFGWHLIAFNRRTIEKVGKWDENFTPYGYDDLDYSYRIQLAFGTDGRTQLWEKAPVEVSDMGMAHSLKKAHIQPDNNKLREYYLKKWGVMPEDDHDNAYKVPFNGEFNSVDYWPGDYKL